MTHRLYRGAVVKLDDGLKHVVATTTTSMAHLYCQSPAIPRDVLAWRIDDHTTTCLRCMCAR